LKSNIFIPKRINVGYQNRLDTYTGKLAYVIYYDEKGVLRKETSWNGWRDKDIPNTEFDNVPTEGFVFNKKVGDYSSGWDHRQAYCRVYDPRGFEFEITIENLLYILENCSCIKGKGIEGELIYGWDGKDLVLMPVESPDYKAIEAYSKIIHNNESIKAKDLIIGATYLSKNNENWIYMGRFDTYGYGYEFKQDGKIERVKSYEKIPNERNAYRYYNKVPYKNIKNLLYGKMYWFAILYNDKYCFEQFKSIPKNKFISCINDKCISNYSEIYDLMQSSWEFSPIDDTKDKFFEFSFEDFYKKSTSTYWNNNKLKYIDTKFLVNVDGEYIEYKMETSYEPEDNGKYIVYKYNGRMDEIEAIDIFPTEEKEINNCYGKKIETHMIPVSIEEVFEKLRPAFKQKYLANGREYEKEYELRE